MGTTSVKLDEETKSRLEELQATVRLETGRKVTQQELLDRIVTDAYETRDELIESFRDTFDGLDDDELARALGATSDWGEETTEDEIDDVLYG